MTALRGRRLQRTAATVGVLALALGGGVLTASSASAEDPLPVVKKLTIPGGSEEGGDILVMRGTDLATWDTENEKWVAGAVKFGAATVDVAKVTALSDKALRVETPAADTTEQPTALGKAKFGVKVLVGAGTKGPKFTYYAEKATVTTPLEEVEGVPVCKATSEDITEGGVANTTVDLTGTNLSATFTKITIGGKTVKTLTYAEDGSKVTITPPKKIAGVNDIAVIDKRTGTLYGGYCVYEGYYKPTVTAVDLPYVINEAPTTVTLTGTDLDRVKTATYNGVKATVKKIYGDTEHVKIIVPAGEAVAGGTIVVSTKYLETDESPAFDRKAAGSPTVSGFGETAPGTTAATVNLVGTNLVGLKTVTATADVGGKVYTGSAITVTSDKAATVKIPALPNNAAYTLKATTWGGEATYAFEVGTVEEEVGEPALTSATGAITADAGGTLTLEGTDLEEITKAEIWDGEAQQETTSSVRTSPRTRRPEPRSPCRQG